MTKAVYKDGVYALSNDEYHGSSGLSRSALMTLTKTPYHFYKKYLAVEREEVEPTPAMVLGELAHTLSLEPHMYDERFVIAPKCDRRTKAGKMQYSEFLVAKGPTQVIKQEDYDQAKAMADVVREDGLSMSLIKDARIESSIYFTHAQTGIQCKARPDIWLGSVIGDLKTTKDASHRSFQRSAWDYGYYLQAGMMHEALSSLGVDMQKFIILAVEKDEPYALATYIMDEEAIDHGRNQLQLLLEKYVRCLESQEWDGYGVQQLLLPTWAKFDE